MRRFLIVFILALLLASFGCLKYYGRSELPTSISVEEEQVKCDISCISDAQCKNIEGCSPNQICNQQTHKCEAEAPIECKAATCMTMAVQEYQKNERWVCSPAFKGANDDPEGTTYFSLYGDECKELVHPDTVCLEYDCTGDSATYYAGHAFCEVEGLYAYLTFYPSEGAAGQHYEGIGSMGEVKLDAGTTEASSGRFICNALSSIQRGGAYSIGNCGVENGCRTCAYGGTVIFGVAEQCKAAMPIIYPYNSLGFEYTPIVDEKLSPTNVVRDLSFDYLKLGAVAEEYMEAAENGQAIGGVMPGCEEACSSSQPLSAEDLAEGTGDFASKLDECNACTEEKARERTTKMGEKASEGTTERGYEFEELLPENACKKQGSGNIIAEKATPCCTGLTPCVEIDRAISGEIKKIQKCAVYTNHTSIPYKQYYCNSQPDKCSACEAHPEDCWCTSSESAYVCDTESLDSRNTRYFVCQCACAKPIYATYECTRPGNPAKYYYSYCERTADPSSQGGYLYEVHNFTGGVFQALLEDTNARIPTFMLGQGPTFDDYLIARSLCQPSDPGDVTITAGGLPFDPTVLTVREGSRLCFSNMGVLNHTIRITSSSSDFFTALMSANKRELVTVAGGESVCIQVGPNTPINRTYSILWIDDNGHAYAMVTLEPASQNIGGRNIVTLSGGKPAFLYDGYIEMDPVFASGYMEGYVPGFYISLEKPKLYPILRVQEMKGERTISASAPGEYTNSTDGVNFTYVAYADGTALRMIGPAASPWFLPGAIQVAEGSKLCVRNEVPNAQKTILLEKKLNYSGFYAPVEAKSSYYGLECCFDLPGAGVYRVSDYQTQSSYGYVVVYPASLISTIRINDYTYYPNTVLAKAGDMVCIDNPVNINRTVEYKSDDGKAGDFLVPPLGKYCSYNFTNNTSTYMFTDTDTGGKFTLYVNSSSVLRIDAYGTAVTPLSGRIDEGGWVCINAVDRNVVMIGPMRLSDSKALLNTTTELMAMPGGKKIEVQAYDMHCEQISQQGAYLFRDNATGANIIVAVGPPDTAYIVNGQMVPGYLEAELPEYASSSGGLDTSVFTKYPNVYVSNLDEYDYTVYTEVNVYRSTGLAITTIQPISPSILVNNNAGVPISVSVTGGLGTSVLPNESLKISLKSGQDTITISGLPDNGQLNTKARVDWSKMLSEDPIVFKAGESKHKITVRSLSSSASGYYGDVQTGFILDEHLRPRPIIRFMRVGSLVIKTSFKGGTPAQQLTAGSGDALDFGVQVVSGVPDENTLMKAREMLAYHQSLPVFLYSRIGDAEVALKNPTEEENYSAVVGSLVNITLDDSNAIATSSPEIPCSETKLVNVGKFPLPICVRWEFTMPDKEIVFTLTKGSATKKIRVKPVKPVQELNFSYDEYSVSAPSSSAYALNIRNLAVEPRAVTLRPNDVSKYCVMVREGATQAFDILDDPYYTAYNMELYSVPKSNLDALENHDKYVGTAKKLADVELLPNMGYLGISPIISRPYLGEDVIGDLSVFIKSKRVADTYASLMADPSPELKPGFLSGLKYTKSARTIRLFTSAAGISPAAGIFYRFEFDKEETGAKFGTRGYTVLLRRLPVSREWSIKDEIMAPENSLLWRGAILTNSSRWLLPNTWHNYATGKNYMTGCGKVSLFVPFNMSGTIGQTKDFSYAFPVVVGFGPKSSAPPKYGSDVKYIYSSSENGAPSYAVLPQILGDIYYYSGELRKQPPAYIMADYYDKTEPAGDVSMLSNDLKVNPLIIGVANGELIAEGGINFSNGQLKYSEVNSNVGNNTLQCGWIQKPGTASWMALSVGGGLMSDFDGWDFFGPGGGYDMLNNRLCDNTGSDTDLCELEVDFEECGEDCDYMKSDDYYSASVFYSQFGTLCGTHSQFCSENAPTPADCETNNNFHSANIWYCRSNPAPFGHKSEDNNVWLEMPTSHLGLGTEVFALFANEPYKNSELTYDFIDQPAGKPAYYEYVLPGFDAISQTITSNCSLCKLQAYAGSMGNKCECTKEYKHPNNYVVPRYGGIPATAFSGGLLFLINDIESAADKFAESEYSGSKIVEYGKGYALTPTFSVQSKKGIKVMCYGTGTYNGIQDILPPSGQRQYVPEVKGTFAVYEPAYYTGLVGSVEAETMEGPLGVPIVTLKPSSRFSHISPFVRDLAQSK
ncbi:MAG: hypothetical protein N3H30_01030, partial [Candidatus Micrarchaeota archaeon]|nr:hypothetical protein [Candidatus Micrarchaeota archaeon]